MLENEKRVLMDNHAKRMHEVNAAIAALRSSREEMEIIDETNARQEIEIDDINRQIDEINAALDDLLRII